MVKKGFLKRIAAVPSVNPLEIRSDNKHDFLVLDKERVYLGRSSKECDLVFREKIISRKHVVFHWSNSQWNIECLNDKNGVFVNGQLLNKNEVKKLKDNFIISFGPNFMTDFLYQFTTKESPDRMLGLELAKVNREVSLASLRPKTAATVPPANSLLPAKPRSVIEIKETDLDQLKANEKKMKQLNSRIQYLEEKMKRYKDQRKESRQKFRKCSGKLKLLQSSNVKQKTQLRNAKVSLIRERLKKKELQKRLADQEKAQLLSIKRENPICMSTLTSGTISPTDQGEGSSRIVRKYNEMFSEDFVCGICLELFIEPVTLTCGHTTCKFCINEWFKRNQNKRECPLCRTNIRMSWYKNVLIENVIEKYLASADQDVLATRNRLIEERAKVVEKSKSEAIANPPLHRHRPLLSLEGANSLIEFFGAGDRISYNDLSFNPISDEGSSNEDDDDLMEEEEIHFLDDSEEYSEEEEEIDEIVLNDQDL